MIINFSNSGQGGSGIQEAPIDGKQYARQDATWTEVQASAEPPIEVVVPTFNFRVDPITIRQDITPEDKTANIAASEAIKAKINAGESPNVVLRQPKNRYTPPYFTPWKVMIYKDVVEIIALQDVWGSSEIVGYAIQADGSIQAYTDWKGADVRNFKTINGNSIVGNGDITISGGEGAGGIETIAWKENMNQEEIVALAKLAGGMTIGTSIPVMVTTDYSHLTGLPDIRNAVLTKQMTNYGNDICRLDFELWEKESSDPVAKSKFVGNFFDRVITSSEWGNVAEWTCISHSIDIPQNNFLKTINGNSVYGSGDIVISGGGSSEEFIYANNPLTEKEKSHNKAAFASGNKIATICNRMSGLDTMCAVIYQYNYNGDYVYDCMYQHTEFLIGYNPSTGDMTSISYNTFYTGTISYNPYYVNVPLYMADGSEVTPLTEDEKHLNSAKIKEMLNYLPPINGHQYSDNIFLAIREIIPIEEVQGLFPLASQYMHNVQTRFTNLHYENGLFTFDDMTFQYTTYIDGKEYEVSSKMLMDGSITLVSLNESVTKKYVDDLVGAANNKLETI